MMNLIKTNGILCVLIGLLVSEASTRPGKNLEEEVSYLKLRLSSLKNRYKFLCDQYTSLAKNYSAPAFICTQCPDGWFQVDDQCFLLTADKMDWLNSKKNCTKMDGHLAILTTKEEHDAIEKESIRFGGFYTSYWIGLTDSENEGDWKWVDKSTLTTPFWNKVKSEPDNSPMAGSEGEDCAVVESRSQTWYDVPCSFTYPRICQKDAIPLE
ncbi:perlucin-like protein isoform X2 [Mastacembelus armatus]|uniref:perlucin-like protein isoform X2 n=1 Tax=Mastacembelus armatus TaxID=205130 RepID=UPI000E465CBC|nr:perlucin-like protein isoform X2 [Mastacembelus armatus]